MNKITVPFCPNDKSFLVVVSANKKEIHLVRFVSLEKKNDTSVGMIIQCYNIGNNSPIEIPITLITDIYPITTESIDVVKLCNNYKNIIDSDIPTDKNSFIFKALIKTFNNLIINGKNSYDIPALRMQLIDTLNNLDDIKINNENNAYSDPSMCHDYNEGIKATISAFMFHIREIAKTDFEGSRILVDAIENTIRKFPYINKEWSAIKELNDKINKLEGELFTYRINRG